MPRTPDYKSGPLYEEEIRMSEEESNPTVEGAIKYVDGFFRLVDSLGVFRLRRYADAAEVGQFLYSYEGTTLNIVKPLVSDSGFMLTDNDGHMVVVE